MPTAITSAVRLSQFYSVPSVDEVDVAQGVLVVSRPEPGQEPFYYSVYGRDERNLSHWVADFEDELDAETFARFKNAQNSYGTTKLASALDKAMIVTSSR